MGKIGRMTRRWTKGQFEKMASGDIVSDAEKRAMTDERVSAADQAIAGQQQLLNRGVLAQGTGGGIASGELAGAAQQLGTAAANAQTRAAGESQRMALALADKRKAQALGAADSLMARNRADLATGMQVAGMGLDFIGALTQNA